MRKRIALVEDDEILRSNYAEFLSASGFDVSTFRNADEALQGVLQSGADLALLDVELHGERDAGFRICTSLRNANPHLPIVFLSSHSADFDRISGMRLGADDYLTKDMSLDYLVVRIEALFRRLEVVAPSSNPGSDQYGYLQLRRAESRASWKGEILELSLTQYWLLQDLVCNSGKIRTASDLLVAAKSNMTRSELDAQVDGIRQSLMRVDPTFDLLSADHGSYVWGALSQNSPATAARLPEIAGYQVLRLIGEGGMARVYEAVDLALQRPVAVKVMGSGLLQSSDFRKRFDEEGQIVAAFRHPRIVSIYARGQVDGFPYFVMEYLGAGSLRSAVHTPMAVPEAMSLGEKIADALSYAHERGVIHRDLKPENVLFADSGEPILADFGIAKSQSSSESLTAAGEAIGSPRYMSPEQLRALPLNDRTDIFSLGIVLFEVLVGSSVCTEVAPPSAEAKSLLRRAVGRRHRRLAELIDSCLAESPSARPSARELRDELARLANGRRFPLFARRWSF